ncbi:MAG: methanogenesis marker 7 protein [Thermoplasmatales archaeon]|nr:methanogenesis marker 7 protein [Thermoplasmatales archaeon]
MFEVLMYDGGVYRSAELYELIEDVGGVVINSMRSSQMLTVTMSVPEEDRAAIEELCTDIGGTVKEVPLAGTEIAVIGPTLGRHHMPHPICDIAEQLRQYGAISVVMGLARGRGKATAQISMDEINIINEYDAAVFMMGNFKSCIEDKKDLLEPLDVPLVLVCGPEPEGMEDVCDAVVSGVGRKCERMRTADERRKLVEIADTVVRLLDARRETLSEDPLYVHPAELKQLLETYEPIDMCLRPAPIVLLLGGLRVKIPYSEHREYLENLDVFGRRLGDIARIRPSRISDSSTIIEIMTVSEVEDRDAYRAEYGA